MKKWRDVEAAFRNVLAGVDVGEITVEMNEDAPGGFVVIDLPAHESDEDGALDAFVEAYETALLEVVRQHGGPDAALRLSVHCGTKKWLGDQNLRTGVSTVVRAGPGRSEATAERRSEVASTPVMTRLRGDAVAALDLLVEAGVVRSRSLAVAWCVDRTLQREAERIEALRVPVTAIREARQALSDVTITTSTTFAKSSDACAAVVRRAFAEAKDRNRVIARPVHLLLALLHERPHIAMAALQGIGVDADALEARADAAAARADAPQPRHVEMSAEFGKAAGEFGAQAAESLGQVVRGPNAASVPNEMEPEHLLLGLLRVAGEGKGSGIPFLAEVVGPDGVARIGAEIARLQQERAR